MKRCIFDWLVFQCHFNCHWASFLGSISDRVSTISVINDVGKDGLVGAVDLHDEGIASISSGISVIIEGVDGEAGGLVVPQLLDSFTLCISLRRIHRPFDVRMEGRIFDWTIVKCNINRVVTRALNLIND